MVNEVRGYKVFNPDWTCRDYDFKNSDGVAVGTTHDTGTDPILCERGFHFCLNVIDCFNYYSFNPKNRVAVVLGKNVTDKEDKYSKVASQILIIEREVTWEELLVIANTGNGNIGYGNTGDWNTGSRNTGSRNTGDWNTGDWNTGDWNTGDWNTGDWNTVDYENGFFNTRTSDIIRVFNKPCKRKDWDSARKPVFLYFDMTYWCEKDKKTKPLDYKEAFKKSWEKANKEDRMLIKSLPNFDSDVFFEISGIRVEDYE